MGEKIIGGRYSTGFFIKFLLIGSAEDVSTVYGKPLKELTDIEMLGWFTARKYRDGELKKQHQKSQENTFNQESDIKLNTSICTLENLLKYNKVK